MDIVYETIKKIPGVSDNEAHEFASRLGKSSDVATKADLEKLKAEMYALNNRTITWICGFIVAYSLVLIALTQLVIS